MAASLGNHGRKFFTNLLRSGERCFRNKYGFTQGCRTLLSDAFHANDTWMNRERLDVNMTELQAKLEEVLIRDKINVNNILIQQYVDNVINEEELTNTETFIQSFRHTSDYEGLRSYTMHSFIRTCLDFYQPQRALEALCNKVHMGLFPDNYTYNLLMDEYLRVHDYKNAVLVAMEMMHTEVMDSSTPLSQLMSLYACHQYLSQQDCPKEEFYDIGMTLVDASRDQPFCFARSYHVLGLVMSKQYENAEEYLKSLLEESKAEGKDLLSKEVIQKVKAILEDGGRVDESKVAQEGTEETDQESQQSGVDVLNEREQKKLKEKEQQIEAVKSLLHQLESSSKISSETMDSLLERELLPQIASLEEPEIQAYPQRLQQWHEECLEAVKKMKMGEEAVIRAGKEKRLEHLLEELDRVGYHVNKHQGSEEKGKEVESL